MTATVDNTQRQLNVELGERSYPIHIGSSLVTSASPLRRYLADRQALIVTNDTIEPLLGTSLREAISGIEGLTVDTVVLPDGERYKELGTLDRVYDRLLANAFDRDCVLIALGGGVIGDMAGFAAATYQRGVAYIQVPTTLLAMVDSAVGGKTGVNHARGKNMIGAFHQPRCVLADPDVLAHLPDREFRAGIAEVIKYGLLGDYSFLVWLEDNMPELLDRDPTSLAAVIETSCRDKAAIVAADEREADQRALLNLGHTFAHAIETATGYGSWLHGEAVAAGLCMAADMSWRCGWIGHHDLRRVRDLVARAGLPTAPPPIEPSRFRELMRVDKKAKQGELRLILLRDLGDAVATSAFPVSALDATLEAHQQTG